ncbi:VPS13 like protein [Cryptosporidium ubiquitum]|uniref:VPS13 like protein n=1 Tax=Cryptosporidium ubiquitum TaxID=857276 RepID=A0A1J4MEC1_9CRYT|nr:VPS13 like protein [Cryptosporidium ubiquitum]OII72586.1 VPS13 like protein [Cryptosporidium ubiquitum]
MSLRELVVGSTQMLVESVLRRINENLLNYFINLPESIWLSGFLDQVNLRDVMFNTRAFSNEWYSLDIPFRLKYGHIRRASIQVLLAQSKLVMEVEGVVLIVGPNLAYKSYEDVIRNSMDNVFGLVELFKHIQTIRYNNDNFGENLGSQKGESSEGIFNFNSSSKEGLNALLRWLFRYVPDLSLSIRNLYIRYEDDVLDSYHPMSAGIHINSVTINPARNCWEFQWPTDEKEQVEFVSKSNPDSNIDQTNVDKQQHPLSINNSNADPRGIFSIKIKGLSAFWDDESAPFIPVSLLEQTEASNDKFGVFSAVTIDDIQNLVNSNLQYHTRIISNLNVSAQFGFVNPFIHKISAEKGGHNNGQFAQNSSSEPISSQDSSSSSSSKNTNNENNKYIAKDYLNDYYTGSNIATLLNINILSGFEMNIYPQMIHGLVRFVTLYNQFQFWTQVRRFRPIERPGSGKTPAEVRAICRDWWIFSLKYYRNIKYKDSKHNSLKDEINYRIERKRYIKIIKKWKWIEFMINGQKPVSDSGTIIHRNRNNEYGACTFGGKNGNAETVKMDEYAKGIGSPISFLDSNLSSFFGLNSQMINHLSRYWQYDVEILQKVSEKSDDMRCILAVLQHHSYWVVSQWHILAEREFEIEFALFQNSSTFQNKQKKVTDMFSGADHNMDIKTKNILTLLAYGLHIQTESSLWELISSLRESYTNFIKRITQDNELSKRIKESLQFKSLLLNGGSVFEFGLPSGISAGVPAQISNLIQENIERHPYVIFGSGVFKRGLFETEILSDFFGVSLNPRFLMKKHDWHAIRLRLHLWGRFYDDYFEAFPLAISETIEISQLMNLSYHLDFQQMNKLFSISMKSDSLCFSTLVSSQTTESYPMEGMDMSMGVKNVTMAKPKNQQVSVSERDQERSSSLPFPSSLSKFEKNESRNDIDHGERNHTNRIEISNLSKSGTGINQGNKEHSSIESNEMVEEESIINNSSVKKEAFKFEKKLPNVFKGSSNVPEWLSDLAGPGISLPKIISNKIIGFCIPKFEINICHLVSENKNSFGSTGNNVGNKNITGTGDVTLGDTGYNANTTNDISGIKRNYHSLMRYFSKNHHERNIDPATSSFTPRKLFGIVITSLGFNMNTCTSLRISSCFKRMELVVWNYNDSNMMREFISSIKSDRSVNRKMIRDDQIVIFSMCNERQNSSADSSSFYAQNKGNASSVVGESGPMSGSGSKLGELPGVMGGSQANSHFESKIGEGGIDGNRIQTPNRRNSSNLNEYDSSPSLTHYVDETQSGTFSSYIMGSGRIGSMTSSKTVRFEDPKGISISSNGSGMISTAISSSFDTLKTNNSELNDESSPSMKLGTGINGTKSENMNTVPTQMAPNSGYTNGLSRYMRRWNYLSLVMLPPNNSSSKENKGEVRGNGESNLSFAFKLPFYLKVDINLTEVTLVLNEQLLDNIRGEIMKLVQVCLLTIWSQYKGLGAFPITDRIRGLVQEGVVKETFKEENNFELLLCHPFNLSLNKYNAINKMNRRDWNKINSLLNKVHVRISIKLPAVELYMLNESIEYFRQIDGDIFAERSIDEREENVSFDLSTSFKLSVEPQTILIGTIIDKLRGNINRLYFRGFQMKFDTQQNITSIIRLYLRFKNLISDRYGNIIAIINLFKGYKFDHISRHSLTSFTDQILRLQCEELPDTNNILLKEFTLSLDERSDTRLQTQKEKKEEKREEEGGEKEKEEEEKRLKVKTRESMDSSINISSPEGGTQCIASAPIPDRAPSPVSARVASPLVSPSISPSISPAQIPSPFVSPTLSAYSCPYQSQFPVSTHIPASDVVSTSSETTKIPITLEQAITTNTQSYPIRERHSDTNGNHHLSQPNNVHIKPFHFYENQTTTEVNTISGNFVTRRKSSKLVLIKDTESNGHRNSDGHQLIIGEAKVDSHSNHPQAKKQSGLISLISEVTVEKEAKPTKNSENITEVKPLPHQQPNQTKKKKPPISLRSGFNFNN